METRFQEIQNELLEEHRLLKELVRKSSDTTNIVLGIIGVILGIAGLIGIYMAFHADKKLNTIKGHTTELVRR